MRYSLTPIERGDTRTVRRFAWIPTRIDWCWVWLEWYEIDQKALNPDGDRRIVWETLDKRVL